jgi:hypothetical protein
VAAKQKQFSFGTCDIDRLSPPVISSTTRTVNVYLPFEEALKLHLAFSDGVLWINKHNRATREGKEAALNLTVHLDIKRLSVNRGKVKKRPAARP